MPEIRLPNGAIRSYEQPVSVMEIAADIHPKLAKRALAGEVGGNLVDLDHRIDVDQSVCIITPEDPRGVEILRHSCAHLLAHAVKTLYPSAQVTIGPVIEDGFYYDFSYASGFEEADLEKIEKKMYELVRSKLPISRSTMPRDEAVALFKAGGENYKAEIISAIPEDEMISLYTQGEFTDLCRGPHVPSTGHLKAFKLTKLAGAYWRGDSTKEMLQRIYGTAWPDKKQLDAYLTRLVEAEKRDHRKLGKQLGYFHFQEEAPGMAFWHAQGWTLFQLVETYVRTLLEEYDYQEVHTPQVLNRRLWERSGHWEKFRENMFTTHVEDQDYAIKPMNCPGHVMIFNQGIKSYRDLPLRISEFGICHRNEPSGTLHGLMRGRCFTQDDAHVFCTEEQIGSEVSTLIDLTYRMYNDFGFDDIEVALSTRPENRVGDDLLWDRSEKALATALEEKEIPFTVQEGEGAFYGPKHEFVLRDSIGRRWQCGTIQLDFSMPSRLGAEYVAEDGTKKVPVMIHRAILGSLERFIGILMEDTEGKLPAWLSPVQLIVCNIGPRQREYALSVQKHLKNHDLRVECDLRNEKIGYKIRHATLRRIPFILVVGDKEIDAESVNVRTQDGTNLGSIDLDRVATTLPGLSSIR
ncbi:MAG: threonine--tRNA ligase [Pirellulales bacterium]|nr:threonine--tRNA ligase [Pirellulales bacterium]